MTYPIGRTDYRVEVSRFFAALNDQRLSSSETWAMLWEAGLTRLLERNYSAWIYVTRAAKELDTTLPSDFDLLEDVALAYGRIDQSWLLTQRRMLDREDEARATARL